MHPIQTKNTKKTSEKKEQNKIIMNEIEISEIEGGTRSFNKERKTEQLTKRNRELQQQWDTKHELSKRNAAESEDQEYFQMKFRQHVAAIENELSLLQPGGDRARLVADISRIVGDLLTLQNTLTTATLFLSNYNVRSYQATLNELQNKIEATKEKLLAKKKFGFRSKKETTRTVDAAVKVEPVTNVDTTSEHINWTLANRMNEEIEMIAAADVNGQDITVSTLENCCLRIVGHPGSLQLSHLTNCVILCGPVQRSVFADNCINCKLIIGCQQLRLHSSNHCDLYMHVTCRAIIEDCQHIRVAPFNFTYANIDDDFAKAGLDLSKNHWADVADFNWLSADVPSPNWRVLNIDDRVTSWNDYLHEFRSKMLPK